MNQFKVFQSFSYPLRHQFPILSQSEQSVPCITQSLEHIHSKPDHDNDSVDDQNDILLSAPEGTTHIVKYIDTYDTDNGGKPPDDEGVYTDLFWCALEGAGYDSQKLPYQDMAAHPDNYPLDKRDEDGLPYLIQTTVEKEGITAFGMIASHYRWSPTALS